MEHTHTPSQTTAPLPGAGLPAAVLFTAFERSGDEHAAPVIAQLRRQRPELTVYALGGQRMAQAGAVMVESTARHGTMFLESLAKAREHHRRLGRLREWLRDHPLAALIPVDSPAANWSICATVRELQPSARVIHLVAPQLWAWAPGRIRKMKRLSDHVLCLLPFEPDWFGSRGMPGTFVGHPVFDPEAKLRREQAARETALPAAPMKLALLPGSRLSEIRANWPMMLAVYQALKQRHPTLRAAIAGADPTIAAMIAPSLTALAQADKPTLRVDRTDEVLAWCDAALLTSGTVALHATAHRKPMVIVYNASWWSWNLIGRWLIDARTFTLPNLIAPTLGLGRIVPELVPHFGEVDPVVAAVEPVLTDPVVREKQIAALSQIVALFEQQHFADSAAARIMEFAGR